LLKTQLPFGKTATPFTVNLIRVFTFPHNSAVLELIKPKFRGSIGGANYFTYLCLLLCKEPFIKLTIKRSIQAEALWNYFNHSQYI